MATLGPMLDRAHFEALDETDPLAFLVARFSLPNGIVYLDGNSLGPLPAHVPEVIEDVVERQWGQDLITSWNKGGWWKLAERVGDKVAPLIGVTAGSVIVADTTTVALYKAVSAATRMRPDRPTIITDSGNFPTDRYTMRAIATQAGGRFVVVEPDQVAEALDESVAVVSLTHVDYRTGRRHDMSAVTNAAHEVGAVMVWDLSHSVGAMDLDLGHADMAVGCGYKYLNGGPGAPAFMYLRPELWDEFVNPVAGWWGHADPFAMRQDFEPAAGRRRALAGTQPILSMAALDSALDTFADVNPGQLRARSELLTTNFIALADQLLPEFELVTPRNVSERGSHVSLAHDQAPAIMEALIAHGVIGDVRPPNLLRFGLGPSFQRHVDVWDAILELRRVMDEEVM